MPEITRYEYIKAVIKFSEMQLTHKISITSFIGEAPSGRLKGSSSVTLIVTDEHKKHIDMLLSPHAHTLLKAYLARRTV